MTIARIPHSLEKSTEDGIAAEMHAVHALDNGKYLSLLSYRNSKFSINGPWRLAVVETTDKPRALSDFQGSLHCRVVEEVGLYETFRLPGSQYSKTLNDLKERVTNPSPEQLKKWEAASQHVLNEHLYYCVKADDLDSVKEAIGAGADVNAMHSRTSDGWDLTPLHAATRWRGGENQKAIAIELLDAGADINGKDSEGQTPLALVRDAKLATFLAARGADTSVDLSHLDEECRAAIRVGVSMREQQELRANLPSVAEEMQSPGLRQSRGRRL